MGMPFEIVFKENVQHFTGYIFIFFKIVRHIKDVVRYHLLLKANE